MRINGRESKAFTLKVGVHHDSVFSPLLFIIVLKALSREFREGLWNCFMWMILYWLRKQNNYYCYWRRWRHWKEGMEKTEMWVNVEKTKVICGVRWAWFRLRILEKNPCGVCRKGVGNNSILSVECVRWVHERYRGFSWRLNRTVDFHCRRCLDGIM